MNDETLQAEYQPRKGSGPGPLYYQSLWRGLILRPTRKASIADILSEVAQSHRIAVAQLIGRSNFSEYMLPRLEAMYRLVMLERWSYPTIGRAMGDRDHTTIWSGARRHAMLNALPMPRPRGPNGKAIGGDA